MGLTPSCRCLSFSAFLRTCSTKCWEGTQGTQGSQEHRRLNPAAHSSSASATLSCVSASLVTLFRTPEQTHLTCRVSFTCVSEAQRSGSVSGLNRVWLCSVSSWQDCAVTLAQSLCSEWTAGGCLHRVRNCRRCCRVGTATVAFATSPRWATEGNRDKVNVSFSRSHRNNKRSRLNHLQHLHTHTQSHGSCDCDHL